MRRPIAVRSALLHHAGAGTPVRAPKAGAEPHFLPGHSPELNPVELLNGDTKKHIAAQAGARNPRELTSMIRTHLHRRQKQPTFLAALFHKPEVAYAAA